MVFAPGHYAEWETVGYGHTIIASGLPSYAAAEEAGRRWAEKIEIDEFSPTAYYSIKKHYRCGCAAAVHERAECEHLGIPVETQKVRRPNMYDDTPSNRAGLDADGIQYRAIKSKSLGGRFLLLS